MSKQNVVAGPGHHVFAQANCRSPARRDGPGLVARVGAALWRPPHIATFLIEFSKGWI